MKTQFPQNNEIDRIGSKMLHAVRLTDDEIDKIVAGPHLFSSIRSSVRAEEIREPKRSMISWKLLTGSWQIGFAAAATVLLFIAAGIGITRIMSTEQSVAKNVLQPVSNEIRQETLIQEPEPVHFVQASTRSVISAKRRPIARAAKRQKTQENEPEMGEFQALGYIGDDDGDDKRIVRVELPRASLFAMGIEIPAQNETSKIKADLLIGSDGVMKAVRVAQN